MHRGHLVRSVFLPFGLVISAGAAAATLRVPADHASIQAAIDVASPGDVVMVSEGEYGVSEPISFRGKDLTLRSESGPDRTTLRMTEMPERATRHSVIVFEMAETPAALLEGFTITGGRGTRTPPDQTLRGGGILCINGASPTIVGCRIEGNQAIDEFNRSGGGGVGSEYDSSPLLRDCTITGNRACTGGGVAVGQGMVTLEGCVISENTTVRGSNDCVGGGILIGVSANATLVDCTIGGNFGQLGGGMDVLRASATVSRCTFLGNGTDGNGGGLRCHTSATVTVTNTVFAGNKSPVMGGAVYLENSSGVFSNCTFTENFAGFEGPAVACIPSVNPPRLNNCIFWRNRGLSLCGNVETSLSNIDPLFVNPGAFDFDRFTSGQFSGEGYDMPDFVVEEPDLHVLPGSLAIDGGSGEEAPDTDRDGTRRPCGGGIDIGAYEFCLMSQRFSRGDANADRRMNVADTVWIVSELFAVGPSSKCKEATDLDDDGIETLNDAVYILRYIFMNGTAPPSPFEQCGADATQDQLGCEESSPICA
jgi:hypothetical protein